MKVKTLIMTFALFAVMTGCNKTETSTVVPVNNKVTLKAYVNNPATKVGFASDGAFYWSKGDKLGVLDNNGTAPSFHEFTLNEASSGQASGTFTGAFPEGADFGAYAVYPYNANHSVSGTTLTYNFPASYTYTNVDGDYFTEIPGEGNSFNAPMWGAIDADGSVQMKHLGGVFCIKIDKMPCEAGTLTLTSDQKISGAYTVDLAATEPATDPQIEAATATTGETDNTVSIAFSGATKDSPGVFYVPAPVGTHKVTIVMTDNTEEKFNFSGEYTIIRKALQKVEIAYAYTSNHTFDSNNIIKPEGTKWYGEIAQYIINDVTYDGIKIGSGSNEGEYKFTLSKTGNITLKLYALGWKGKKATLKITLSEGATFTDNSINEKTLIVKGNDGMTGNSKSYKITTLTNEDFFSMNITNTNTELTITLHSTSDDTNKDKRAGIFGLKIEQAS